MLDGGLRGEEQAENGDVEDLVIVVFGDAVDRLELVGTGVVDQDVETAKVLDGGVDDFLGGGGFGGVSAYGNCLAASLGDGVDDAVGSGLAGGVVDDPGGTLGCQRFGDGGSAALG